MDLEGYSTEQPVTVVVYPEEDEYPREDESAADGKVTVQLPVNGHHAVVGVEDGTSSNVVVKPCIVERGNCSCTIWFIVSAPLL